MERCAVQRPRRPQLSDTIIRFDEMIDGLSTAIPGAVAESVRDVLGTILMTSLRDAVREAVREGIKEAVQAAVGEAVAATVARATPVASHVGAMPSPQGVSETRPSAWGRVKALSRRLREWIARRLAPVAVRLALGWAVVKILGASTIRSRSAAAATVLAGALGGLAGYVVGPVGAAVLLGLAGGAMAAAASWATPAIRYLFLARED
jgi:hypothetical protein